MNNDDKYHIEEIKKGSKESFEIVFVKYYRNLCKYAYSILNSEDDAEDVVTDVFTNIWDKKDSLNVKLSLGSYLFRSVYNRSLNVIRNRKIKIHSDELENKELNNPYLSQSESDYPMSELVKNERLELVKAAIDRLPKKCRNIFIMHRKFRCKYSEIAEMLEISEHTVKAQVQIALQKLRNDLIHEKKIKNNDE